MPRILVRLAAIAGLALSVTGCGFTKPSVAFKDARLSEVDLEGATLMIDFALKNPNPIALDLATIAYQLEVEGHPLVSGKPPNGLHVPARAETSLAFPARVRFQDVAPTVEAILAKDQASYRASGRVGIRTPIGVIELPLSHSGTFPVPKVPHLELGSPRIEGMSLRGARVVIPVQVTNRNPFALPLGGLSATLSIAGARVGTAQAALPARLAANEVHIVEIPLQVSFLECGTAVAHALSGGAARVKIEGALQSGSTSVPVKLEQELKFH